MSIQQSYELPQNLEVSGEFKEVADILEKSRDCFFVTGDAGTGKSTLLKYFRMHSNKNMVVLAPTGVAAINVRGQTIHSFFNFPPKLLTKVSIHRKRNREIFKCLDTIVIDEVSMVRIDVMDSIDYALRMNTGVNEPFGGLQLIMFGDLAQLPPIVQGRELRKYFKDNYTTPYFFGAKVFDELEVKYVELTKVYRQKDRKFISLLNKVKSNDLKARDLDVLNERVCFNRCDDDNAITLSTTNRIANEINYLHLGNLEGKKFSYQADTKGTFKENEYPADEELVLKVGAQIMLLRNDTENKNWVNGSIARVERLTKDAIIISLNDETHEVRPEVWEKIKYSYDSLEQKIEEKPIGTFKQFPIKLAWAITIHKSQGKTFDEVTIDLGDRAFTHGQVYVALSRCTTLSGISLERAIRYDDIIFDKDIDGYKMKFEKVELQKI